MIDKLPSSPLGDGRWVQYWQLFGLAVAGLLLGVYITRDYVMDDALITLRYSFNFARAGSPFWNPADINAPTLGYTTPLWMLINTVPALFTEDRDRLLLFAKWFSVLPLLAMVSVFVGAIDKMKIRTAHKAVLVMAIFSQVGYGFHLNSGMETLLFSTLLLLTAVSYNQKGSGWRSYAIGTLAFLTRPEGAIAVAFMFLMDVSRGNVRRAVLGATGFGLVVLVLAMLLYQTYGQVLPNPFYLKQGGLGINGAAARHTVLFLTTLASPFLFMTAYSVVVLRNTTSQFVLSLAGIYVAYFLTVAPLMNVLSRYQWPVLVLLTLGSLPFLAMVAKNVKAHKLVAASALGLLVFTNIGNGFGAHYFAKTSGRVMDNLITIGKIMNRYSQGDRDVTP